MNEQVYSIASLSQKGKCNMNIATYIVPITMKPKQYLVAVYRDTETHQNIFIEKQSFLLQALSLQNISTVKVLGKKSGKVFDKVSYILKQKPLYYENIPYLQRTSFVLACVGKQYIEVGDHDIIVAEVIKIISHSDEPLLGTVTLQAKNIIG